jgi:Uma2 family endonuclease
VAATEPQLHRLAPEIYDRMVEAGLLEGQPVELIDGLLIHMTPQGAEHAALVQRLTRWFATRSELLRVRMPLAVPGGRPEPDLALAETTVREHPSTALLVVEVAVSQQREAHAKLPGYAAAAIPEVWIVDVPSRSVDVFTDPAGREYRSRRTYSSRESLDVSVPGIAPIALAELFAGLD